MNGNVNRSELRLLTYKVFGNLLEVLTNRVISACIEHSLRIDIVAPILRSGAFPGCHLASKLGVTDIVPLQYKHTYDSTAPIRRHFKVPSLTRKPRGSVTILMVDTNTVTGEIARHAAEDLRAVWPSSKILFASVMLDLSIEHLPHVEVLISALRTNERRSFSARRAMAIGVSSDIYIFPWENVEEQWAEIQSEQSKVRRITRGSAASRR